MNRVEFKRCAPEAVGIDSKDVLSFLDNMNDGHTEMHSLMIMRHQQVVAEGWWAPYAPGMRHTMMSTSKTFTATAIALACQEGILSLDDYLVDIFSEYVPENASDYLKEITIRHLMTMTSGMEEACVVDENYIANFMNTPVLHKPGTDFFYNDSAASLLPAIIYRKTGLGMIEFLKPRLFDKIGIDAANLTWFNVATGTAFGTGGLHCTTEDAVRLMCLYANDGKWDNEQILAKEYVEMARVPFIKTNTKTARTAQLPKDNQYGYGYLMWMGSRPGTYRSEGAYGQITVVDPMTDTIISFTEANYAKDPASQESMNRVWKFLETIDKNVDVLPDNPTLASLVKQRFSTLALPQPPYQPFGKLPFENMTYRAVGNGAHPENLFYQQILSHPLAKTITGIESFALSQKEARLLEMEAIINGQKQTLLIPTDGSRLLNRLPEYYKSLVYTSAYWQDEHTLAVRFRWIETVFEKELFFHFEDNRCLVKTVSNDRRHPDTQESLYELQ